MFLMHYILSFAFVMIYFFCAHFVTNITGCVILLYFTFRVTKN
jgi:hypothetical protein